MILEIMLVGIVAYLCLLMISFTYSCGGYSIKDCGFCWVGIVQSPLDFVGWIVSKIKGDKKK